MTARTHHTPTFDCRKDRKFYPFTPALRRLEGWQKQRPEFAPVFEFGDTRKTPGWVTALARLSACAFVFAALLAVILMWAAMLAGGGR